MLAGRSQLEVMEGRQDLCPGGSGRKPTGLTSRTALTAAWGTGLRHSLAPWPPLFQEGSAFLFKQPLRPVSPTTRPPMPGGWERKVMGEHPS